MKNDLEKHFNKKINDNKTTFRRLHIVKFRTYWNQSMTPRAKMSHVYYRKNDHVETVSVFKWKVNNKFHLKI